MSTKENIRLIARAPFPYYTVQNVKYVLQFEGDRVRKKWKKGSKYYQNIITLDQLPQCTQIMVYSYYCFHHQVAS